MIVTNITNRNLQITCKIPKAHNDTNQKTNAICHCVGELGRKKINKNIIKKLIGIRKENVRPTQCYYNYINIRYQIL